MEVAVILAAEVEGQQHDEYVPLAATNSGANGPDTDAGSLGGIPLIDTIRVRARINSHQMRPDRLRAQIDGNGTFINGEFAGWVPLDGGGRLSLDRHGGGTWASVEASLPNRHRGHNLAASGLDEVGPLLLDMLDESEQHVTWASREPEDIGVSRLDLVRDFHGV